MVSEKMGRIRFYDLIAEQPIASLEAGHVTMMSADWCPTNSMLVGAVAAESWHIWDISASRLHIATNCIESSVTVSVSLQSTNPEWISPPSHGFTFQVCQSVSDAIVEHQALSYCALYWATLGGVSRESHCFRLLLP